MIAVPYTASQQAQWDTLVAQARNATFLHQRSYLAYLGPISNDCSLCFYHPRHTSRLIAAIPACKVGNTIISHPYLTYGGLILAHDTHLPQAQEAFTAAIQYYKETLHAQSLIYRPTPHIYHTQPSDDDLYILQQLGATCTERKLSTALTQLAPNQLRRRELRNPHSITCSQATPDEWPEFHQLLTQILLTRHNARPTHTLPQLLTLANTFPTNIRLYLARKDQHILAGTVVYLTQTVAHLQYIAASDQGKQLGALTILIQYVYNTLIRNPQTTSPRPIFLDFGTSMEPSDHSLNRGLCQWKESFGGTAVVYDTYQLSL